MHYLTSAANPWFSLLAAVCDTYIVEAGDTISSISSQFNVLECEPFPAAISALPLAPSCQALLPHAIARPAGSLNSWCHPAGPPPAADLQDALTKCIRGYTPGVFLQPHQIICLPPWYDACANVVTAGEQTGFAAPSYCHGGCW